MADPTYQPKVYRRQGGDEQVIASGGVQTVESGGSIDVESGGDIAVESGGSITLENGASIRATVTDGSSSVATIPPAGIATVTSTGKADSFAMSGAPTAGDVLYISCDTATTTGFCLVVAAAGVTFSSTAALRTLKFNTSNTMATCVAVSATRYAVDNSTAFVPTST